MKNPDNPFAALKPSMFPDAKKRAHEDRVKLSKAEIKKAEREAGNDEELFELAMSSVGKIDTRTKAEKRKQDHPSAKKSKKPEAAPVQPEVKAEASVTIFHMDDSQGEGSNSAFPDLAQAWRKKRKEAGRTELPVPPAKEEKKCPLPPEKASIKDGEEELSDEQEIDMFYTAMNGIHPLAAKGRDVNPELPVRPVAPVAASNPLQDLVDGKVEFELSGSDEFMEGHVVGLDLLTVGKLQAGQFSPEAHIDLHGLNSEQAFHHLVGFFRNAYYRGARTALVVTGRGLNSPDGMPILRSKMRQWFTQDPFRRVILAFCTAQREDGGTGALYVLLRKYKKNAGKVYWDALPADPDLFI